MFNLFEKCQMDIPENLYILTQLDWCDKKSKSNEFRSTKFESIFDSLWGKRFVWNEIQVLIFGLTNGWRQRLATQAQKPHERQNLWWMCSDSWNLDLDDIKFLELVRPSSNGAGRELLKQRVPSGKKRSLSRAFKLNMRRRDHHHQPVTVSHASHWLLNYNDTFTSQCFS